MSQEFSVDPSEAVPAPAQLKQDIFDNVHAIGLLPNVQSRSLSSSGQLITHMRQENGNELIVGEMLASDDGLLAIVSKFDEAGESKILTQYFIKAGADELSIEKKVGTSADMLDSAEWVDALKSDRALGLSQVDKDEAKTLLGDVKGAKPAETRKPTQKFIRIPKKVIVRSIK